MRTEQIKHLLVIRECGSLSKAAEKLRLTAPALSLSVKALEEELGMALLERSNKGVQLTEDCLHLLEIGTRFLRDLEELKSKHNDRSIAFQGVIDFFCGQNAVDQFFPHVTYLFHKKYPGCYVNPIVDSITGGLAIMSKDMSKEMLFCYDLWNNESVNLTPDFSRFAFHALSTGRSYCACSKRSGLARQAAITYEEFSQYPLLIYRAKSYDSINYERTLSAQGDTGGQTIVLDNQAVYHEMLLNEVGVAHNVLLPFKDLHDDQALAYIPIIESPTQTTFQFGYLTHRHQPLSKIAQGFIDFLQEYLAEHCV